MGECPQPPYGARGPTLPVDATRVRQWKATNQSAAAGRRERMVRFKANGEADLARWRRRLAERGRGVKPPRLVLRRNAAGLAKAHAGGGFPVEFSEVT